MYVRSDTWYDSETENNSNNVNRRIHNTNKKSNESNNLSTSNIVYIKDLIEFRKENIIYFLNNVGLALDNGAKKLTETNKYLETK